MFLLLFVLPATALGSHQFKLAEARRVEAPTAATSQDEISTGADHDQGALLFSGTRVSDFKANESAPGAVTEVANPAGGAGTALQMTVANSDVYPITPTDNPRAQLLSPAIIEPGDEFWWHSEFFLPASFPDAVPGWLNVLEGPYGAPYAGSPPWSVQVNGDGIRWQRNSTYDWDIPWEMPLVTNQWVEVLMHCRFGSDGWVEMWIDGRQVTFFAGATHNPDHVPATQRLDMKTMDASNDGGPNFAVIQSYRQAGMFNSVSLYQGPMLIGETRSSVES